MEAQATTTQVQKQRVVSPVFIPNLGKNVKAYENGDGKGISMSVILSAPAGMEPRQIDDDLSIVTGRGGRRFILGTATISYQNNMSKVCTDTYYRLKKKMMLHMRRDKIEVLRSEVNLLTSLPQQFTWNQGRLFTEEQKTTGFSV